MTTMRISLIALGIALGLYACSTEDFEGPSIVALLGEFDILDSLRVTDSNPDFSVNDVVGFHAEFNKEVDWTLIIEGHLRCSPSMSAIYMSLNCLPLIFFFDVCHRRLPLTLASNVCL